MSTPTPKEITAALDTLHRMPYVRSDTTLAEIRGANTPFWWMTRDILGQLDSDSLPNPGELASILATSAACHGLRITTEPELGELVAYTNVYPPALAEGWLHDEVPLWMRNELDAAIAHAKRGCRTAAVFLLPEGGKA